MRPFLIVSAVAALPAAAEPQWPADAEQLAMLDQLGAHGCTLEAASAAAVMDAGHSSEAVQMLALTAQDAGQATQHGNYMVFDADICTIRLPEINSAYDVDHPAIRAAAPYMRDAYELGGVETVDEGCFLQDTSELFRTLEGGDPKAGFESFMAFVGAGVIAGDLRFYEISPLKTPVGFQIMSGPDCSDVVYAQDIARSHRFIVDHFDDYVRFVGANTECGDRITPMTTAFIAELQGFDMDMDLLDQPRINAWLGFEMMFITMAAGWHEGMTDTDRGTPRPPLCHTP